MCVLGMELVDISTDLDPAKPAQCPCRCLLLVRETSSTTTVGHKL